MLVGSLVHREADVGIRCAPDERTFTFDYGSFPVTVGITNFETQYAHGDFLGLHIFGKLHDHSSASFMTMGATMRSKMAMKTRTSGPIIATPALDAASSALTLRLRRETSA